MSEELEFQVGYLQRKLREVENRNFELEEELDAALTEVQQLEDSLIDAAEYLE